MEQSLAREIGITKRELSAHIQNKGKKALKAFLEISEAVFPITGPEAKEERMVLWAMPMATASCSALGHCFPHPGCSDSSLGSDGPKNISACFFGEYKPL